MKNFTKEEKQAYMSSLRERWSKNKALADQDQDARLKWQAVSSESPTAHISYYGFYFTLMSMKAQNLQGLPYVDAKTFKGWRDSGFTVRKGEHSTLDGITWITSGTKPTEGESAEEEQEVRLYPKQYALFHRSQVEAI